MSVYAWLAIAWIALAVPVAVLLGKAFKTTRRGEQREPAPAAPQADGQVDLLAGLPIEILGQAEIDALFVRIVSPLDREMQ